MSGFISGLIGSAASLLLLGVAWLLRRHRHHAPGKSSEWALIAAIILSLLSGVEMTFAGAGSWIVSVLNWVKGILGDAGPTVFALIALGLLIAVVVAVAKQPDEKAMTLAFLLPLVCATFSFGFFQKFDAALAAPAQLVTAQIQQAFGITGAGPPAAPSRAATVPAPHAKTHSLTRQGH